MLAPSTQRGPSTRDLVLLISLLWLAGNGLRITILAVPPVIPLIRTELGMSETQVGILTGLPPVLFACTAVLGSLLIARFGARGVWAPFPPPLRPGRRRRHQPPRAAAAGGRRAAEPHRIRHRRVHQRAA